MTKYVQGKDGKFAGSIGDGKSTVPSASDIPKPPADEPEYENTLPPPLYHTAAAKLYEVFSEFVDRDDPPVPVAEHHFPPTDLKVDYTWLPEQADADIVDELAQMETRLIVVDVETTGFRPEDGAQTTEIAWYSLNSGQGGSFIPEHTLEGADPDALRISRYDERLAGQPQDDGKQVRALHAFLGGDGRKTHVVGSNPGFDATHLNALFVKHGLTPNPWAHRMIDPAAAAYWMNPDAELGAPTGLKEASAHTGVPLEGHHAARVDVDATAGIWHALEAHRRSLR